MNLFRNIYYSQYYEFKKKGKEEKAFVTGNVLIATLLVFVGVIFFFLELIFFPDADLISQMIVELFPNASANLNGRILGAIFLSILFLVVRFTIGTRKRYDKNIAYFNELTLPKQKRLVRKGNRLFISVGILMMLLMFTGVFILS